MECNKAKFINSVKDLLSDYDESSYKMIAEEMKSTIDFVIEMELSLKQLDRELEGVE